MKKKCWRCLGKKDKSFYKTIAYWNAKRIWFYGFWKYLYKVIFESIKLKIELRKFRICKTCEKRLEEETQWWK